MASKTQGVSRKEKSPHALPEEVYLNVLSTADALLRGVEELLKPPGLTPSQYNVLRILRGAGPAGLACREIGARMLTRDPDMTRLLDRLETRGLVVRARDTGDRRVVLTRIAAAGLKLLKVLDAPVAGLHRNQLKHMGAADLRKLAALLEQARETGG